MGDPSECIDFCELSSWTFVKNPKADYTVE